MRADSHRCLISEAILRPPGRRPARVLSNAACDIIVCDKMHRGRRRTFDETVPMARVVTWLSQPPRSRSRTRRVGEANALARNDATQRNIGPLLNKRKTLAEQSRLSSIVSFRACLRQANIELSSEGRQRRA
jgi:hypothetical protein